MRSSFKSIRKTPPPKQKMTKDIDRAYVKQMVLFFLFFKNLFYLFIFGCIGPSLLCAGFLQLWRAGATLHCSVRCLLLLQSTGSRCVGFSSCGSQAQQLWHGLQSAGSVVLAHLVTPQHVGSSQTRTRTHVPCIGRWILNHCATREAPHKWFLNIGKDVQLTHKR